MELSSAKTRDKIRVSLKIAVFRSLIRKLGLGKLPASAMGLEERACPLRSNGVPWHGTLESPVLRGFIPEPAKV